MDSGAREWHVAEGDSFIAGDALAQIDTDKASMDFKRKTGFCRQILIPAGNGEGYSGRHTHVYYGGRRSPRHKISACRMAAPVASNQTAPACLQWLPLRHLSLPRPVAARWLLLLQHLSLLSLLLLLLLLHLPPAAPAARLLRLPRQALPAWGLHAGDHLS
jgi:hypothetical protein